MWHRSFLAALLLLPSIAFGQNVQQAGNVTPGHVAAWATTGVIIDGGVPGGPIFTGSTTVNDFACVGMSGTIIDCGVSASTFINLWTSTINTWTALQNFSGGATAPTRSPGDNTTNVATTAFVDAAITAGPLVVGTTGISGGTTTRVLFDNSGILGEYSIGTSGHAIPFLDGANTWSGVQKPAADVYFGSGRPWVDVRSGANSCAAALGNNSNDDTSAIQCQLTYMSSTYGAGVVFVPCGNYHVTSQLTIPAGVFLVGQGQACSFLNASSGNVAVIQLTGNYAGMVGIFVLGNLTSGATQTLVSIASGTVGVQIRDSYLEGGLVALQSAGIDCYLQNNFIGSAPASASISLYLHGGVCKIIGNKIDTPTGTGNTGVEIDNISSGGTAAIENLFIGNDISGYTTAVLLDDSADASGRTVVTSFIGGIIGGPMNVHSARSTSLNGGELAGNITVNGTTAGSLALDGVQGLSAFSAPGAFCAGNINISCSTVVGSLPTCVAALQGSRMFVTDQATAVAYHGAVTGSGAFKQNVMCDGSAWYQD